MNALEQELFAELNALVADLGKDGGLISPSVYDTAQLLRLYPPPEGVEPGLDWLISQQKADGGWGDPAVPTARDVPTLAAILTIFTYRKDRTSRQIVNAGLEFLEQQAEQWADTHVDALPTACEVVLPYLLKEAQVAGLQIDQRPYERLFHFRDKKLHHVHKKPLKAGTAPTYSWEALDLEIESSLLDGSGGVGHSPAATAAWLKQALEVPSLQKYIPIAERYLSDAGRSTLVDIPGVVPHTFPIIGFELAYSLYALHITGLIDHPNLAESVNRQGNELYQILKNGFGVSYGNYFVPDLDTTSTAVVALRSLEYPVEPDYIRQFQNNEHFYTFPHELNPSVLSNAHAIYALNQCGDRQTETEKFLIDRQLPNGNWRADKWHTSQRYTALEVMLALLNANCDFDLRSLASLFVNDKLTTDSWNLAERPTSIETVYGFLALWKLNNIGALSEAEVEQFRGKFNAILEHNHHSDEDSARYWLGKELYSAYRVDEVYALCAKLLAISLLDTSHEQGLSIQAEAHNY